MSTCYQIVVGDNIRAVAIYLFYYNNMPCCTCEDNNITSYRCIG